MGNQPKVLQISLERDVQLHHTANAWKPPSHKTAEAVGEQDIEVCTSLSHVSRCEFVAVFVITWHR